MISLFTNTKTKTHASGVDNDAAQFLMPFPQWVSSTER
jgi:hypothetical protein